MRVLILAVVLKIIGTCEAQWCMGGELIKSGLSRELQLKILERHNTLRDQVAGGTIASQPMAENMKEMIWDDELAVRAQAWADRCLYQHDPDRRNTKGQLFGQNLSQRDKTWSTDSGEWQVLSEMIAQWFDEVYTNHHQPHFSQLIWANTHKIGCGYSEFKRGHQVHAILVCNYFPSGNIIGYQPYEHGSKKCEKHGLSASRTFRSLCAADGEDKSPDAIPNPSNAAHSILPSQYLTPYSGNSFMNIQGKPTIIYPFIQYGPVQSRPEQYQLDGVYQQAMIQPTPPTGETTIYFQQPNSQYGQMWPSYQVIRYQPGSFQFDQNQPGWSYRTTPNIEGLLQKLESVQPYRYEFAVPSQIWSPISYPTGFTDILYNSPSISSATLGGQPVQLRGYSAL